MKMSINKWRLAELFLIVLAGIHGAEAMAASLRIADIRWTHAISDSREPTGGEISTLTPAGKPLYLWVKLRGGVDELEKLKATGRLTVIHKWEYTHFGWKTERIDVSIGREQALDDETIRKLGYELEANGYFEWRTWSKKDHLYDRAYTVTLVDGFDEPFACQAESTCTMTITIE